MGNLPSHSWRGLRRRALAHGIVAVVFLASVGFLPAAAMAEEPARPVVKPHHWQANDTGLAGWKAPSEPERQGPPGYRLNLMATGSGSLSAELWVPAGAEPSGRRLHVIAGLRYAF